MDCGLEWDMDMETDVEIYVSCVVYRCGVVGTFYCIWDEQWSGQRYGGRAR